LLGAANVSEKPFVLITVDVAIVAFPIHCSLGSYLSALSPVVYFVGHGKTENEKWKMRTKTINFKMSSNKMETKSKQEETKC
jgi:hypothetical protein